MTRHDITQVQQALGVAIGKVVAVPVEQDSRIVKFALPFVDRNGQVFTFYAYRRAGMKKIFLTDAGAVLQTLQKSGLDVQMNILQRTMKTFGLTVLEDGTILEDSQRPLWQRVMAVFQGLVTADGILRTWTLPREE